MNIKTGQAPLDGSRHTIRVFDVSGVESLRLESTAKSAYPLWVTFMSVASGWGWVVPDDLKIGGRHEHFNGIAVMSWPLGTQPAWDNLGRDSLGTLQFSRMDGE